MIELRDIRKTFRVLNRKKGMLATMKAMFRRNYKEIHALGGVSFGVGEGEIVGFIGPNGAGKSTTIKVMSGILVPDSGECSIMGFTPWVNRRKYVANIGVVFGQRMQLWWDVPVQDSYDLLRDIYSVPEAQFRKTLGELTEALDMGELLKTPLRQLSLGQRMRCEIAASLLHSPRILFLDEPTIGLDAVSKLAVRRFIRHINETRKTTVILTTHDMDDIEALTDRIILIGKGNILYDGSMRKVRQQYDHMRTITVNFAECKEPVLPEGAELVSWDRDHAVYRVDTDKVKMAAVLATLSEKLSIFDMTSETSPIEEIIAAMYREEQI